MYSGDFSAVAAQIYNPFSTIADPANPGEFLRSPFMCDGGGNPEPATNNIQAAGGTPCNKIPASMLNSQMVAYSQKIFPAPVTTSIPGVNGINTTPVIVRQDDASLRFDEQINEKNTLWIRYSGFTNPTTSSGGFPGIGDTLFYHGYQAGAKYTHTFGGNAVADVSFGRTSIQVNAIEETKAPQTLWPIGGFTPLFADAYGAVGALNPALEVWISQLGKPCRGASRYQHVRVCG